MWISGGLRILPRPHRQGRVLKHLTDSEPCGGALFTGNEGDGCVDVHVGCKVVELYLVDIGLVDRQSPSASANKTGPDSSEVSAQMSDTFPSDYCTIHVHAARLCRKKFTTTSDEDMYWVAN